MPIRRLVAISGGSLGVEGRGVEESRECHRAFLGGLEAWATAVRSAASIPCTNTYNLGKPFQFSSCIPHSGRLKTPSIQDFLLPLPCLRPGSRIRNPAPRTGRYEEPGAQGRGPSAAAAMTSCHGGTVS